MKRRVRSARKSRSLGKLLAKAVGVAVAVVPLAALPALAGPAGSASAGTPPMVACITSVSSAAPLPATPCPAGSPSIVAFSASGVGGPFSVTASGAVFEATKGQMPGMNGQPLAAPIVGIDATTDGNGYWLVASDGGVFSFGDAPFYGSMGGTALNRPIVGITSTPSGKGYWLVASDGGVFAFGDAQFEGSVGGQPLNAPMVGMASTSYLQTGQVDAAGTGYYLVAADGGVFAFGNAQFDGSMGSQPLNAPIVGMASTSYPASFYYALLPAASGYYLVGADGGVFSFGNAPFYGSAMGLGDGAAVGIAANFWSSPAFAPLIAPSVFTSEGDVLDWIG
jgi:hypothetical protein